uniref:Uncharacterized protein n=1 Tax=Anser brachyrhynchus TaxID=132585 RepID=A0A8B9CSQ1_9AVES
DPQSPTRAQPSGSAGHLQASPGEFHSALSLPQPGWGSKSRLRSVCLGDSWHIPLSAPGLTLPPFPTGGFCWGQAERGRDPHTLQTGPSPTASPRSCCPGTAPARSAVGEVMGMGGFGAKPFPAAGAGFPLLLCAAQATNFPSRRGWDQTRMLWAQGLPPKQTRRPPARHAPLTTMTQGFL